MLIYRASNKIDGKVYVGKWQGSRVEDRWRMHLKAVERGSPYHFHRAIRLYGPENFSLEVIAKTKDTAELVQLEMDQIKLHKSYTPEFGYNMTMGGDTPIPTLEILKKMSDIGKQRYAAGDLTEIFKLGHTEESHKKISNTLRGIEHSSESNQSRSRTLCGKKKSLEHCAAISEGKSGKKMTPEAYAKRWTPEARLIQSEKMKSVRRAA